MHGFLLPHSIPLLKGETVRVTGGLEDVQLSSSRRRTDTGADGPILMKGAKVDQVYQIPRHGDQLPNLETISEVGR
jgi:hypothetical protein